MNKKMLSLSVIILLFALTGLANATVYDFRGANTLYHNSMLWTVDDLDVNITAHEVINDNLGNVIRLEDSPSGLSYGVYDGSGGLGARSYATDGDKNLDGSNSSNGAGEYIHDDGLLFSFVSKVTLKHIDFGGFRRNDDFNLTIDGVTYIVDFNKKGTSPYVTMMSGSKKSVDNYWFDGLSGYNFLIWADGKSDEFRIDRLTVDVNPVPEPATVFLLSTCLLGMLGMKRKNNTLALDRVTLKG